MLSGSCLCKQSPITIKVNKEPKAQVMCYCRNCRKLSGNVAHLGLFCDRDTVEIADPANKTKEWKDDETTSGHTNTYMFCGECAVVYANVADVAVKVRGENNIVIRHTILDDTDEWINYPPVKVVHGEDNKAKWAASIAKLET